MPATKTKPRSAKSSTGNSTLLLIALFKLVKGTLLLLVAAGALHLFHRDVEETLTHWVRLLRVDPENHYIHELLSRVFRVTPKQLRELSIGTFLYASVFLTEGTGLLLRKKWAEYLTIVTTGGFVPLELYELGRHPTAAKAVVLAINVGIVVYLVMRLRRDQRA